MIAGMHTRSSRRRTARPKSLWSVVVAVVALRAVLGDGEAAAWTETFPGGVPQQTWIWNKLNGDGSAASASATYGPGTAMVSSTVPVFPEGGPLAFFGVVPVPFATQLIRTQLQSTGTATMPRVDAGVLGLLDTNTLNAYSATIDYNAESFDISKIAFGSPSNLVDGRDVPGFDRSRNYTTELETYGQSITGRVYDSNNRLVLSLSAVDLAPYAGGLGGLAVSRPSEAEAVRATYGASSSVTPSTARFWTADGTNLPTGPSAADLSSTSTTFLQNGSGAGTTWNGAVPAVFTADSTFWQHTDSNAANYYPAYQVPQPTYIADVVEAGVPVSNAIKFYSNLYSIRWKDNGDPTFTNFTSGTGLVLSGTVDFDVAPEVIGTVSARITGAGSLRKTGPGTLNLVNMFNSFTGGVTIDEGTVYVGANGYENSGVTNILGAANAARQVVVNAGGVLEFRSIEGMAEANSVSPTAAQATQTLVANGGLITNNIMIEQQAADNPLDNWHYQGAYTAVGNVQLSSGTMLGQATFWNDLWTYQTPQTVTRDTWPGFQAFMLQGGVTSTGNSTIAMQASTEFLNEWNRVSGTGTGGDGLYTYNDSTGFHLNWSGGTTFNVSSGTLTVSANLLDSPAGGADETPGNSRDSIRASLTKTGAGLMIMSGSNWMTGGVTVSQGTLRATNPGGNQPLQFTPVSVAGGALQLGGAPTGPLAGPAMTVPSLDVGANSTATLPSVVSSGGRLVVSTGSLSVAEASSGKLDLGIGAVSVATGGITEAGLLVDLLAGRNGGGWDGTGGITSADAAASGGTRSVGWLDDGAGNMLVAFAAPGDTNLDAEVDVLDVANVISAGKFGTPDPAVWSQGDFNYDGVVDIQDVAEVSSTGLYNAGNYLPTTTGAAVAAVPEPSALALVALASGGLVAGLLRRRGRPARG